MESSKPHISLALAWLGTVFVWAGTLFVWIGQHFGVVLNTSVGIAAIIASVYAALASREKKNFYKKESEKLDSK